MLLLPLLIDQEHRRADVEQMPQRVKFIMYATHAYFYVQVATWTCFVVTYGLKKSDKLTDLA